MRMMMWPLSRTALFLLNITLILLQIATVESLYVQQQRQPPTRCIAAYYGVSNQHRITYTSYTTTTTTTTSLRSYNNDDEDEKFVAWNDDDRSVNRITRRRRRRSENDDTPPKELRFGPLGSLDLLVIAVSLFFVATVAIVGKDALLATPTTETLQIKVDADQILQSDFLRNENSVPF